MDDDQAYEILGAISARSSDNGSHVIAELETPTDMLPIAIPVGALPPLIALIGQASGQAHEIAGTVPHQQILETVDTEVYRDDQNVDIHFRLIGGVDLPLGMTLERAAELRDRLSSSLAGETSLPPDVTRQ